jgi:hypothetical protein
LFLKLKKGGTLQPKPRVLIDVLCGRERGGWINPLLTSRLFESMSDSPALFRPVTYNLTFGVTPVDKARNQVVQRFLASDSAWLLMLDNDVIPPVQFLKAITDAEDDGKFVFGLPYPIIKERGLTLSVGHRTENPDIAALYTNALPDGWTKVDYVGTGFMAIRRCVLEAIKEPWFEFTATVSEDFNFCRKAQAAGFHIWTNGAYICDHLHTCSLLDMLRSNIHAADDDRPTAPDPRAIAITFGS